MCTFLMEIFVSLYEDWDSFWHHKTLTTEVKSRILAGIVGSNGMGTDACNCSWSERVTGIWLAGGGPTAYTLPPGGSILLANDVKQETLDARMEDLVALIIPKLEQAREELLYRGIFVDQPLVHVTTDELVCQRLATERDKHFGLVTGRFCRSDAIIEDRRYNSESFAMDLLGIRPDTLEDIALGVCALLDEPSVLMLDRTRKKSVVVSIQ